MVNVLWYHFIAAFFAGAFFVNAIPHYVAGVSGKKFTTPFARPRAVGLSSPTVNVAWGLFNFAAAAVLCACIPFSAAVIVTALASAVAFSFFLSVRLSRQVKDE